MSYRRTSPQPVVEGGTGAQSFTAYAVITGGTTATGALQNTATAGTAGQLLVSGGAAALPAWTTLATGVSSVTGTANQVTSSPTTGAVTLSTPVTFIAPGSIAATTSVTATLGNVAITAGNLTLPATTTSGLGNILIGGQRFMHGFGALTDNNTFVGRLSGNYTLTSATSKNNTGCGYTTFLALTTGIENSAFGVGALSALSSGSNCVGLGLNAGLNYTNENSNICIGSGTFGTVAESNRLRIGNGTGTATGNLNAAFIQGINGITNTTASSVVLIGTNGQIATVPGGATSLNTGTQTLNVSTDASNTTVNLATGAAAKLLTVGSTNGASSLALKYGTADFSLASATGNVMVALDTGEITYPLQPAFLAYLPTSDLDKTGAGGGFTVGSATALTEVFDQNSDFTTAGVFTAPVTARYFLSFQVSVTGCTIATQLFTSIAMSNRTATAFLQRAASNLPFLGSVSGIFDMDAADTATFVVATAGEAGATNDIVGDATLSTFMSGHLAC